MILFSIFYYIAFESLTLNILINYLKISLFISLKITKNFIFLKNIDQYFLKKKILKNVLIFLIIY